MSFLYGWCTLFQNAPSFYYIDVWSSKYTWGGIQIPEEGDFIVVPKGMTLLLDVSTPIIKMLLIQGMPVQDIMIIFLRRQ